MRFPAKFWWWVGGERYPVKRVRSLSGHGSEDKGTGECDTTKKMTRLLHTYPIFTNELMNVLHENTEEIVTELHIDPLEQNGKDEDEDQRNDAYVDLIAHGRAQFLHSLIEQHILEWGSAMRDD